MKTPLVLAAAFALAAAVSCGKDSSESAGEAGDSGTGGPSTGGSGATAGAATGGTSAGGTSAGGQGGSTGGTSASGNGGTSGSATGGASGSSGAGASSGDGGMGGSSGRGGGSSGRCGTANGGSAGTSTDPPMSCDDDPAPGDVCANMGDTCAIDDATSALGRTGAGCCVCQRQTGEGSENEPLRWWCAVPCSGSDSAECVAQAPDALSGTQEPDPDSTCSTENLWCQFCIAGKPWAGRCLASGRWSLSERVAPAPPAAPAPECMVFDPN